MNCYFLQTSGALFRSSASRIESVIRTEGRFFHAEMEIRPCCIFPYFHFICFKARHLPVLCSQYCLASYTLINGDNRIAVTVRIEQGG